MSSILVHHNGAILSVMFTPANCPDKDPDVMHTLLAWAAGGVVIGAISTRH